MPSVTDPARLIPLARAPLPAWCDAYLAPPGGDFFAGRAWYDTVLTRALPRAAAPRLAACGAALVPLLAEGRRLRSLTTPYTLGWRPLTAPGADGAALRDAGRGLAGLLRGRGPTILEALDEDGPGTDAVLRGAERAGLALGRYHHFGNWHEALAPGERWTGYLAARPPALRTTVERKLRRAARSSRITLLTAPGPALEEGIAAFHGVRSRSWKPPEPFPDFDAALMRAAATIGALRLGILSDAADGKPLAAQYWVVSGGCASLLKLVHDETARAASPGTALTAAMIRGLIENDRVSGLDFGRGDDPYKALWVTRRRERRGAVLTDPWHPAGMLELARQAAASGRRRLLHLLQPAGGIA